MEYRLRSGQEWEALRDRIWCELGMAHVNFQKLRKAILLSYKRSYMELGQV